MRPHLILVAALAVSPVIVSAQFPAPPLGATVQATLTTGRKVEGELLAVSADSLWIRRGMEAVAAPLTSVTTLAVRRGTRSGTSKGFLKMAIFGAASGLIMTAACSSIDDHDDGCGAVFFLSMATSLFVGLLSSPSWESRTNEHYYKSTIGLSGIWARFPQGWPSGVLPEDVVRPKRF